MQSRLAGFFCCALLIRLIHSYFALPYHICGDQSLTLLMANDWDDATHRLFFWGQHYMRTYDIWLLGRLGHLLYGAGNSIPIFFNAVLGNTVFVLSSTILYRCLLELDFEKWSRPKNFLVCLLILGFSAPVLQKVSFGMGSGYSLTPLIASTVCWAGLRLKNVGGLTLIALGVLWGISIHMNRLHVVPVGSYILTLLSLRVFSPLPWIPIGLVLGAVPELALVNVPSGEPSTIALFPLLDRAKNLIQVLPQLGNYLGTIPAGWFEGEHALWFREHWEFAKFWRGSFEIFSALFVIYLIALAHRQLRDNSYRIFFVLIAANCALIVFKSGFVDVHMARRYSYSLLFVFDLIILLLGEYRAGRFAIAARVVALSFYFVSSLYFRTPFSDLGQQVKAKQIIQDTECVVGHGGDLAVVMAYSQRRLLAIDLDWRLAGNYSRDVSKTDLEQIRKRCSKVYLIENPWLSQSDVSRLCPTPKLAFSGVTQTVTPVRHELRVFECAAAQPTN